MSAEVNRAIATGHAEGWISSASLLVVGPAAEEAIELGLPDVGVHLAATGFAPCTDLPARLRAPDGTMNAPLRPSEEDLEMVAAEWRAQLAAVRKPTHLDTHEHLHFQPRWFTLVRRLAEEHSLPMRLPGIFAPSGRVSPRAWLRRALRPPVRGPDHFGSVSTLQRARALSGVVEMMVHPGNPHDPRYAEEVAWLRAGRPGFPPARLASWTEV